MWLKKDDGRARRGGASRLGEGHAQTVPGKPCKEKARSQRGLDTVFGSGFAISRVPLAAA